MGGSRPCGGRAVVGGRNGVVNLGTLSGTTDDRRGGTGELNGRRGGIKRMIGVVGHKRLVVVTVDDDNLQLVAVVKGNR